LLTKENLTSTQLAKRLKMSQPPVWRMLNSMIKEGRVIRENRIGKRNIPYSLAKWRN
jgi:Mn-dependent DtxR family transcriptional regulator|tara:strand:+ start:317 stop:487 length:171 start_codon:yes stop_codon:yes gene_type:complete